MYIVLTRVLSGNDFNVDMMLCKEISRTDLCRSLSRSTLHWIQQGQSSVLKKGSPAQVPKSEMT